VDFSRAENDQPHCYSRFNTKLGRLVETYGVQQFCVGMSIQILFSTISSKLFGVSAE
jgi:hypothetical protein